MDSGERGVYDCAGKFGFVYRKPTDDQQQQHHGVLGVTTAALPNGEQHSLCAHTTFSKGEPVTLQSFHSNTLGVSSQPTGFTTTGSSEPNLTGSVSSDSTCGETVSPKAGYVQPIPPPPPSCPPPQAEASRIDTELRKFAAELRKICSTEEGKSAGIERSLELFVQDLKLSGLYQSFLESDDAAVVTAPATLKQDLQKRIDALRATIEFYKCELQEWDEVTEQKRLGVEDAKKTFESERDVDFSQLHCEDVDTLKSYLTPNQASILEQPSLTNPTFVDATNQCLDAISLKLDEELKRIQEHCHVVNSRLKVNSNMDASVVEETPRTLFKALKHHY